LALNGMSPDRYSDPVRSQRNQTGRAYRMEDCKVIEGRVSFMPEKSKVFMSTLTDIPKKAGPTRLSLITGMRK